MALTPPCQRCVYFVPGKYSRTGSCARYMAYRGRGKIVYEFADSVRLDRTKCGPDGRFFRSEKIEKHKFIIFRDDDEE
jgi:hypothetical protein